MLRSAFSSSWVLTALGAVLAACAPTSPPPMDTAALPTARTSAEALYISTESAPPPAASSATSEVGPVPVTLPASAAIDSARTATCPQKHCWRSWLVPRPGRIELAATAASPELGVAAPVAVWQEKLRPNVKLDFPRAKGIGMLGVVLGGVVTAAASEGATLAAMKPWSIFVAPGAGLSLTADGHGGAALLIAYPLDGSLANRLAALRKSDKAVYWEKRPGAFVVDDLERIERQTWAGGAAHAWLGFEGDRSPQAYLGVLMMGGDVPVADHEHKEAWEILVPIRAHGKLVLSGEGVAPGVKFPREVPVRPGEVVTMPPGVHHAFEPDGDEPLLAVQLFVPPGAEQRFRDLAKKAAGVAP